jgi:predicted GIY-YIG superfamily endonuclease
MSYIIYRAFDKNGKSYVGFTSIKLERRISGHYCESKKNRTEMRFHKAIRMGTHFDWEVLCETNDKKDACSLEKEFIKSINSIENGYNDNRGGIGLDRKNIECRKKISTILKEVYHAKPETRLKHSYERGGKPVYVFKIDGTFVGEYPTQIDACDSLGLPPSKVCLCLQGKRKTVNGFSVRETFDPPTKEQVISEKNKRIRVYDNGVFKGEWDSMRKCAKDLHRSTTTIRMAVSQEYLGLRIEVI